MHIDAFTDETAFAALKPEWNTLVRRSAVHTPFQTNEFQRVWWSHFGSGELCVLAVRDDAGELVGLASLFVDPDGVLRWVGGEEIADYLDVVAPADQMEAVRQAVFDWLAGPDAPGWQRAQLSNIPEWTGTPEHWQSLAHALGWQSEVVQLDVCPVVPLPTTFDDYLAQIDKKQRQEIRRKRRRLSAVDTNWYIVAPEADIAAETEMFLQLMAGSHPEKKAFLTSEMRAAFHDIFHQAHAAGWLQLSFFEIEGRKVATYACFDVADRIWVYNSGLDVAAAASSPGWVLLSNLIEHAIETGHREFDFLQGDEAYKYRFGSQVTKVYRLTIDKS